ncbi:MAG: hypothetical protein IPL32_00065 [Chloracidobacterium sp.]|nr:hypothetical protein [Chloracidobacterium sp.]
MDAESIQIKYGDFNDPSVSDAAGRSLDLVELLHGLTDEVINEEPAADEIDNAIEPETHTPEQTKAETKPAGESSFVGNLIDNVRNVNRWLLGVGFVLILVAGGLYVWSSTIDEEKASTAGVAVVDLGDSILGEHIKSGKRSPATHSTG